MKPHQSGLVNQITSKHLVNLKVLWERAIGMKSYSSSSNGDSQKAFDNFLHGGLMQMLLNGNSPKENFETG